MREIVTVQVGGFANFIGSHFWNFQDELLGLYEDPYADPVFKNQQFDMDVLYRTGETSQGILTYTPRLLSIDLQGSLGSVSSRGTLYNEDSLAASTITTWDGSFSTHTSERYKKNLFLQSLDDEHEKLDVVDAVSANSKNESEKMIQDADIVSCLEKGVKFWTDYSKVHYHPQSLYELKGLHMDAQEFNNFGIGREAISYGSQSEEINERLRFFVEECDHTQGFQFVVDDCGGFSAVASEFLENIADEYTNTPVLLYTARDPISYMNLRNQNMFQLLHEAVSFSRLSALCNLMVPVGLPSLSRSKASKFLRIEDEKPYHCSAVYAAALHCVSLPFRMGSASPTSDSKHFCGTLDMNYAINMLSGQDRRNILAILDIAMPAPSFSGKEAEQSLLGNLQPVTPEVEEDVEDLLAVEAMSLHGIIRPGGSLASISEVKDKVYAAYGEAITRPRFCHLSAAQCPLPIPLPFPSIFANVSQFGELLSTPVLESSSKGSLNVHSIPMATRLRSSSAILPYIENRRGSLRRFGIQRGSPGSQLLRSWGFAKDELEDMGEALWKMVMELKPHIEMSSDSD